MSEDYTIIRTKDLTKAYGSKVAVNHLNLSIKKGEIFGLLGPNGAGKTTTILMLLGLTEPTLGSAAIDRHDCTRDSLQVKRITGYLPDNVGFYGDMTGRENLRFTARLNGVPEKEIDGRIDQLLERVGMTYAGNQKTSTYSKGMRQRLGIADVLMKDPEIIIMDEPTLGIDPEGMRELTALIKELSVQDGRTILLSSHQLYQVQQICDRVGIFVKGKLIASGSIDELGRQLQNEGYYVMTIQTDEGQSDKLLHMTEGLEGVVSCSKQENDTIRIESRTDLRRQLFTMMVVNNITVIDMHQRGGDLDEIYHKYFEKAGESDDSQQKRSGGLRFRKGREAAEGSGSKNG